MVAVHIVHAWWFWAAARSPDSLTATQMLTLDRLVVVHCAMVLITGVLTVLVFRSASRWVLQWMGPVVATLYLVHGAICTAIGLESTQSVSTYLGYCLGMAVILYFTIRTAVIA